MDTDIREEAIVIKDPFFLQEAYTFIYDESNRPVALGKNRRSGSSGGGEELDDDSFTDDSIMAKCITNFIRTGRRHMPYTPPKG